MDGKNKYAIRTHFCCLSFGNYPLLYQEMLKQKKRRKQWGKEKTGWQCAEKDKQAKYWQQSPDRISDQDKVKNIWSRQKEVVENKSQAGQEKSAVDWLPLGLNTNDTERLTDFLFQSSPKL